MTPKPSPSVQGVRPTPRELAAQLRQRLDITEGDEALLTAAITRDREQGRAAEAEEIARLRKALTWIAEQDIDWSEGVGYNVGRVQDAAERALAAPLAPTTTDETKETP